MLNAECIPFHNTMTRGSPIATTAMTTTGEPPIAHANFSYLPPLNEWVSSKSSSTKLQEEERRLFRQRLLTFSPWTYFAKPSSLSPIVCARFGWKNVASDMLVCTNCQAAWAVVFRSELSASATQHLTSLYREQLSSSHMDGCFFRKEAAQYLESNSTKSESTQEKKDSSLDRFQPIVPTLLARVFSSDLMEILEHPNPANQLSSRWRKMLTVISSSTESDGSLHFPNMQVPQSVLDYRPPLDPRSTVDSDAPDTSSSGPTLLTRIVTKFEKAGDGTTETALSGATMESVAALVLLGWIQCQDANESTDNTHTTYVSTTTPTCLSLECPMCLARMELPLTRDSSTGTSESPPPRKRSRQLALDPVQSHRHYCPYVCGFPTAATIDMTPIWQSLALRLLRDDQSSSSTSTASQITTTVQDGADHDDAWIRKMLQSAVSPRSRQPVQLAPLRK